MTKLFSVASWNVEHFKEDSNRIKTVVEFLKNNNAFPQPDIFAIYEVKGSVVYHDLMNSFPDYTFHITEGQQTQEILVGVRTALGGFFTQRLEFRTGTTHMRLGALLSFKINSEDYSLLFLHLASLTKPRGWGLRDEMLHRAVKFQKPLLAAAKKLEKDKANYIFLGDLNTMGLEYPFDKDIDSSFELKRTDRRAERYYNMRRLPKTHEVTYWNGPGSSIPQSNLDHVYATKHMKFTKFGNAEVLVTGWVDKANETEMETWINQYSDHSLLYFEVENDSNPT